MSTPKTCSTCAHRAGSRCRLGGVYIETERNMPIRCGVDFAGWIARPGVATRVRAYFIGWDAAIAAQAQKKEGV